jgi:hypothetical protein
MNDFFTLSPMIIYFFVSLSCIILCPSAFFVMIIWERAKTAHKDGWRLLGGLFPHSSLITWPAPLKKSYGGGASHKHKPA